MGNHEAARAPGRSGGTMARAWHGAVWLAGDAARSARWHWNQLSRWECAGALITLTGAFFLALFSVIPMSAPDHRWCAGEFALLCAGGLALFLAARWHAWRRG